MKKFVTAFFLLYSFTIAAQNSVDSIRTENSDTLHKPYYFVYSSWIGYEHFFDDGALTSWLTTQGQGFTKPDGYYKFTAITIDYLPHNRAIIGASFLDQACAVPFQGGPRMGGFNMNFHFGIRWHIGSSSLDFLCALKYNTLRIRFDSPPPFYKRETDYFNSTHQYHFEYYSMYNAQMAIEPSIRYSIASKSGQSFGIIVGYHYALSDEGWVFNGVYHSHSPGDSWSDDLMKDEQMVSESSPSSIEGAMSKGFFVQVIIGMNVKRKSDPKFYLYRGNNSK
jgi:hypothetical protein